MTKTISIRCDLPKMEGAWHFGPVSYDYGSGKLLVPLIEEASPAVSVPLPQEIKADVDELRQEMTGALALLAQEMRELREAMAPPVPASHGPVADPPAGATPPVVGRPA